MLTDLENILANMRARAQGIWDHIWSDLAFSGRNLRRGDKGPDVKRAQEFLCINDIHLETDGDFGPATEQAVELFQSKKGAATSPGVIDIRVHFHLIEPLLKAFWLPDAQDLTIGQTVVQVTNQHLAARPFELKQSNLGPWVRAYMRGSEGKSYPWCAGFVSTVLEQALMAKGISISEIGIRHQMGCDQIADIAQQRGWLRLSGDIAEMPPQERPRSIPPGSLFLNWKHKGGFRDRQHVGFVVSAGEEAFQTIEGNTNDEGSREGYEVCRRTRAYRDDAGSRGVDFVVYEPSDTPDS